LSGSRGKGALQVWASEIRLKQLLEFAHGSLSVGNAQLDSATFTHLRNEESLNLASNSLALSDLKKNNNVYINMVLTLCS